MLIKQMHVLMTPILVKEKDNIPIKLKNDDRSYIIDVYYC